MTVPVYHDSELVDIGRIDRYLVDFWRQAEEDATGGLPVSRVKVLNLVLYGEAPEVLERAEHLASVLPARHPSRIIAVHLDAGMDGTDVEAGVSARCLLDPAGRRQVCSELITLHIPAASRDFVPNSLAGLLVADLPVAIVWTGEPRPADPLFRELAADLADKIVYDSVVGGHDAGTMQALAAWRNEAVPTTVLADMAWARLLPWRHVLTEFFDHPALRPLIPQIREVEITTGGELLSGDALLVNGWLASRLRWGLLGVSHEENAILAIYRTGAKFVHVRIQQLPNAPAGDRMMGVKILAGPDKAAYIFEAHRGDDANVIHGHTTAPGAERTPRGTPLPEREDDRLLEDLLDPRGPDPVYEDALTCAADLVTAATAVDRQG